MAIRFDTAAGVDDCHQGPSLRNICLPPPREPNSATHESASAKLLGDPNDRGRDLIAEGTKSGGAGDMSLVRSL